MVNKRNIPGSTFRASRAGLAKVLGDLEAEIMTFFWKGDVVAAVPAKVVFDKVGTPRGVSYITVVTVLNNLWRKGLLRRRRRGRVHCYQPALSRDAFLEAVSRRLWKGMLQLAPDVAVSSFVEAVQDLLPEVLDELSQRLSKSRDAEPEP